jgi:hypothetical protein
MRGALIYGPRDVRLEERVDPKIIEPTDAIIRLSATCICGSDLWPYRASSKFGGLPRWVTSTSASSIRSAVLSARSGLRVTGAGSGLQVCHLTIRNPPSHFQGWGGAE